MHYGQLHGIKGTNIGPEALDGCSKKARSLTEAKLSKTRATLTSIEGDASLNDYSVTPTLPLVKASHKRVGMAIYIYTNPFIIMHACTKVSYL